MSAKIQTALYFRENYRGLKLVTLIIFLLNCNLKLILFSLETTQDQVVDGEALKCMSEDTLKTIVPPAGVCAKLIYKIKKLNDEESGRSTTSGAAAIEVLDEDEPRVHSTKAKSPILDVKGETSGTIVKR